MTQIAIVLPAAPQLPPAGPPAAGGSQQFSSHFEKAVSRENQKEQIDTRKSQSSERSEKMQSREKSPAADSTENARRESPPSPPAGAVAGKESASPAEEAATDNQVPVQPGEEQNIAITQSLEETTANIVFVLPSDDTSMGARTGATGPDATPAFSRVSSQSFIAASAIIEDGMQPPLAEEKAWATPPQPGQKSTSDTMLAQLQLIIENSDEKGTVTITREDKPSASWGARPIQQVLPQQVGYSGSSQISAATSEYADATTESPLHMLVDGWTAPAEKTDQQTSSLRQNTQQQYYEAKINMQSFGNNDESPTKDGQQGNDSAAQAQVSTGQNTSTTTFLTAEHPNTFSQSLTSAQSTPLPADATGTVTLPSGTVVREEDVIQQMLERFQISRKRLDTQINLKLHPAELGELKIDLSVKEGSIRANVVAQSQHAQEIIEKNMARLKTVLEEHGFTIEAITVSSKFDSNTEADLFDRQLFSQNEYTPQPRRRQHEAEATFRTDEAFFPAQQVAAGVNVKI